MRWFFTILFFSIIASTSLRALEGIGLYGPASLMNQSAIRLAVEDCLDLLQQACECQVLWNPTEDFKPEVALYLPDLPASAFRLGPRHREDSLRGYPIWAQPEQAYAWEARFTNRYELYLQASSPEAWVFALYALLQERLGFAFYHPKEQLIPRLETWPLAKVWTWQAKPRFATRGFHLHTMHPIELTEALLNPRKKDGLQEAKRYVDWLLRNGQNYFEFNLLSTIPEKKWHDYIAPLIDYAHERGIRIGIDVSLHMRQQKAYRLYEKFPKSWRSKNKQIERNLSRLMQNPWDAISLEFSKTEFNKGKEEKRAKQREDIAAFLAKHYPDVKLLGRVHVVKPEAMLDHKTSASNKAPLVNQGELLREQSYDNQRGSLIHTVMFYALQDSSAPVYRNKNFEHLLDLMQVELKNRETWYYPESAYWITFDNSVPMLLLPYLKARLEDIYLTEFLGLHGHLTFSSGWEWGYWLIDWSIARWSWAHTQDDKLLVNQPLQYLGDLFVNKAAKVYLEDLADLQEHYIKDLELIRYLAPSTVTDELPRRWHERLAFQPRPQRRYRDWHREAGLEALDSLQHFVIDSLQKFARKNDFFIKELLAKWDFISHFNQNQYRDDPKHLLEELLRALRITGLRASHRAATLTYLRTERMAKLNKQKWSKKDKKEALRKAKEYRQDALVLVEEQELWYRYDVNLLGRSGRSSTAYPFGYLYPVSNLHFWRREEFQVRKGNFSFLRRNIWPIAKIMGWR